MSGMRDDLEISPTLILRAYAAGVFPMADSAESDEIFWVDPKRRGILPLDKFHLSHSLRKRALRDDYEVRVNSAFPRVIAACADRPETWINAEITDHFCTLYRMGYAHSVEIWIHDNLVGGLYGIAMGGVFFGESMFSRQTDASKLAMVALVARLRAGGYALLDTQFVTDHLISLGAVEISRAEYHRRLEPALTLKGDFWKLDRKASHQELVQLITQTS
jgi:leucyl/phenylalanyl-tRNA--protein transferase